jgi:hypothetical protein
MQSGKMLESSGAGTQPKEMMSKVKCLDGIKYIASPLSSK